MAATGTPTPNIGLRIPIGTDPASVDDINYNSNLLDTKLGAVGSDSVQDQIDTLNGKMANRPYYTEFTIDLTNANFENRGGWYRMNILLSSITNLKVRMVQTITWSATGCPIVAQMDYNNGLKTVQLIAPTNVTTGSITIGALVLE